MFLLFLLSLFKQHKIINLKYVNWLNVFMKKALEYSPVFQMQRMCDDVTFTGSDVWRYVCVCEYVKRKPFVGTVLYVWCCFAIRNLHFAIDFTFLCMIFVFIYYYCKTIWEINWINSVFYAFEKKMQLIVCCVVKIERYQLFWIWSE